MTAKIRRILEFHKRASGGWVFAYRTRLGTAQRNDMGPLSHRPTTRRKDQKGLVHCDLGGNLGQGP